MTDKLRSRIFPDFPTETKIAIRSFSLQGAVILSLVIVAIGYGDTRSPRSLPQLLPAAQDIVDRKESRALDSILGTCEEQLTRIVPHLYRQAEFLLGESEKRARQELIERLDPVERNLLHAGKIIDNLMDYMDAWPIETWQEEFGRNGFYDHISAAYQQHLWLQCLLTYYRVSPTETATPAGVSELKTAQDALSRLLNESETSQAATLRLWLLRFAALRAGDDSVLLKRIGKRLGQVMQNETSPDRLWNLKCDALRLAAAQASGQVVDLKKEKDAIEKWITDNGNRVSDLLQKLFEFTLLWGHVEKTAYNLDPGNGGSDNSPLLASHLRPVKSLLEQHPELQPDCYELIARQLDPFVRKTESSDTFTYQWDSVDLLALAGYYQKLRPSDYKSALKACELYLEQHDLTEPDYPGMLYERGLLHYRLHEQADNGEEINHLLETIHTWISLAGKFPYWQAEATTSGQASAKHAVSTAAALTWQLYNDEPEKYEGLAMRVLSRLTGQIPSGMNTPNGPFAQTDAAATYRFYYALLQQESGDTQKAGQWYALVPPKDEHYHTAMFRALRCRYQLEQEKSLSPSQRDQSHQDLARDFAAYLNGLPESHGQSEQALRTLHLLARLTMDAPTPQPVQCLDYLDSFDPVWHALPPNGDNFNHFLYIQLTILRQLDQRDRALNIANGMVGRHGWVFKPQMLSIVLKIVQEKKEALLEYHATNRLGAPGADLIQMKAMSDHLCKHLELSTNVQLKTFAKQNQLEIAALYLIRIVNIAEEGTLSTQLKVEVSERRRIANKLVDEFRLQADSKNALWLLRCRALLLYSDADYGEAQQLFARIRQATGPTDPETGYCWWEARYYGLACLAQTEDHAEARRIAQMVLQTYPEIDSPWKTRLSRL
jgi:hypothetical protein